MKRAYLVCGPESSGNRLTLSILQAAGCKPHTKQAEPRWQSLKPEGDTISLMRSMPHGGKWDCIKGLLNHLESFGYQVVTLVPVRDITCIVSSQVSIRYTKDQEAGMEKVRRAYSHVLNALIQSKAEFYLVPYESLVLHPKQAANSLLSVLGLPSLAAFHAFDQNLKHYTSTPEHDVNEVVKSTSYNDMHDQRFKKALEVVSDYAPNASRIVDLGGRSKLTEMIEKERGVTVVCHAEELRRPLNLDDCSADLVLCTEVLEHLCETGNEHHATFGPVVRVLKEVFRVLTPGGRVIISTPNAASYQAFQRWYTGQAPMNYSRHYREYTMSELTAVCNDVGLREVDSFYHEDMNTKVPSKSLLEDRYSAIRGNRLYYVGEVSKS